MKNDKGELYIYSHTSSVLKYNPLGDPYERKFPVYFPPSYSDSNKRYPVVFFIAGFTGTGFSHLNRSFMVETIQDRFDRLIKEKKMKEMIVVMPDCITKFGGSQYINSTATGQYEDYVVKELVPFVDKNFRTIPEANSRAICGKSSGGYGAMILSMKNPGVFGLMCSTAGDAYFEYCYKNDFASFITDIERYGKGDKGVVNFIKNELNFKQPKPKSFHNICNMLGMASCYSPNPKNLNTKGYGFDIPIDLNTGELRKDIFNKWLKHDPVQLVTKYKNNLKKLKLIFLDAGKSDEFALNVGARIFSERLTKNRIKHYHEEFNGGHFNIQHRYDRTFEMISKHIKN
jgi:enterochelin esterase family protein